VPRVRRPLLALLGLVAALAVGYGVQAGDQDKPAPSPRSSAAPAPSSGTSTATSDPSGLRVVPLSDLPPEASDTYELVQSGGPYPYPRNDGVTFHNFERILPSRPDGYYREYTVETPGEDDRGPRRLVVGRDGSVYYTADHYDSFVVVDAER